MIFAIKCGLIQGSVLNSGCFWIMIVCLIIAIPFVFWGCKKFVDSMGILEPSYQLDRQEDSILAETEQNGPFEVDKILARRRRHYLRNEKYPAPGLPPLHTLIIDWQQYNKEHLEEMGSKLLEEDKEKIKNNCDGHDVVFIN